MGSIKEKIKMNIDEDTFAKEWVESWNSHDLDRILSHYSDDFEITSPLIKITMGIDTDTLSRKQNFRDYWATALRKIPTYILN